MSVLPDAKHIEQFRALVADRLGLHFDDGRTAFLADILRRRLGRLRLDANAYLARLESSSDVSDELRLLAPELTTTETYFFRSAAQLHAFDDLVLTTKLTDGTPLRILSAGCASGEEPYSLAMLVRERCGATVASEVSILGVDVNAAMLAKAARGRYSAWALRETTPEQQSRWFAVERTDFVLDASIRRAVRFEERNLSQDDAAFWKKGTFDVVFFRNVLMYFTPGQARAVLSRIAESLTSAGLLFLGHAETLRGISQDFHLRHTHDTFYYQRRGDFETVSLAEIAEPASTVAQAPLASVANSTSWVEAIRLSADRVRSLTKTHGEAPVDADARSVGRAASRTWDSAHAIDLLSQERFTEARSILSALPPESARDADALLLRAVLLTHGGAPAEAELVCEELLELDETNAGARYLMALCRENAGDPRGAADQDQIAAYLDPSFAMPRLHLGLLARRARDQELARRELAQALALLEREEPSRLLLFGGGFKREALIALCRAELVSCGGGP